MANIRLIKGRIKSAKNIAQITKAMELVAASKMKKAQAHAVAGKQYAQKIYEMVMTLASRVNLVDNPLLKKPKEIKGRKLAIFITSNKGLCGGLNTNLFRFFYQHHAKATNYDFVVLGKKGLSFVSQVSGTIKADFSDTSSFVSVVPAVTDMVTTEYIAGNYDAVELYYSEFVSILRQDPKMKTILPLTIEAADTQTGVSGLPAQAGEFTIEPSVEEVFNALLPHYLENQIRDAVLQAEASEHSARMLAMRNATDNALALMDDLTLVYNKARQEKITYEISDIITATLGLSH
jgi:F-type H+-transporting ATPase subunit gamma